MLKSMAANDASNSSWGKPFSSFSTMAIHAGQDPEQWQSKMIVPPITVSTTFKQHSPGDHMGFEYGRSGHPTRKCLENCAAACEGGEYGLAFASGMSATTTVVHLLKAGDHILCDDGVYWGTNTYLRRIVSKFNVNTTSVDFTDISQVENGLEENTKIVWVETPSNPTMKVTDIQAVANLIKSREDCLLVVDNTFMSSYFQRPLQHGADIVMHSATKYMNGHSDVVMGLLVTNSKEIYDKLKFLEDAMGPVPSPFDCYLVNRGLKTLAVRMERHQKNALAVAKFLEKSPMVEKVKYPGLPSHPQFEIMKKQATGCSGMVAFWFKGDLKATESFLANLKVFTLAESLGGFESLAKHRAIMTKTALPDNERNLLEMSDNFIRLSVGLEDADDLVNDLEQAMKRALKI